MFVLANFIKAIALILQTVLDIYFWIILIRALLSWVNPDPLNPIVRFLERVTEPVLSPIRKLVPPMGIDFSPLIAALLIYFIKIFVVGSLYDLGFSLRA
ncbi:MAG: YggT family protein [Candidatus Omnitrophica bacterium]|nr:YggT family protein [Candidatus Omnitrophota bacterium]